MTTYVGTWDETPVVHVFESEFAEPFELTPHRAWKHRRSCEAFAWGYSGAGSRSLALALLLDATQDPQLSLKLFTEFSVSFCRDWPVSGWSITSEEIQTWVGSYAARLEGVTA